MRKAIPSILASFAFAGILPCTGFAAPPAAAPSNPLTPGNVSLHLQVGKTTQTEVLEVFGAPNIVTQDGQHQDVWSYQRHASVVHETETGGYFNIIVAGAGSSRSSRESTERTVTLIIKFDANHVVSDFQSRASEF